MELQVCDYMAYHQFPKSMRTRVTEYFDQRFQGKYFDEDKILAEITPNLRVEIWKGKKLECINSLPFLSDCHMQFKLCLCREMTYVVYLSGDCIFHENDDIQNDAIYFIIQGQATIKRQNSLITQKLVEGQFFGEQGVLGLQKRTATLQADSTLKLYKLPYEQYSEVLECYPKCMDSINRYIEELKAEELNFRKARTLTHNEKRGGRASIYRKSTFIGEIIKT